MKAPRWRAALALMTDVAIGSLPPLAIALAWVLTAAGALDAGAGVLIYYGIPTLLFTGPALLWASVVLRAHRGSTTYRSLGLVLTDLARNEDGALVRFARSGSIVWAVTTRLFAGVHAALSVVGFGFVLFSLGIYVWALRVS